MLASPLALLIPFLVALTLSVAARFAGPERNARFGGLAVPVAFLVGWMVILKPGWLPTDALTRVSHIVFGAALVGFVCDAWLPRRLFAVIGALVVLAACAYAHVTGSPWPRGLPSVAQLGQFILLLAIGIVVLWRVDRLRSVEDPHLPPVGSWVIVMTMWVAALTAIGAVAEDVPSRSGAAVLLAVVLGHGLWAWISRQETIGVTATLTAVMAALSIGWTLWERAPFTGIGLVLSLMIPFAGDTARRVPLPKAGVSRLIAPLVLAAMAAVPLALAAAITLILFRSSP